MKTEITEQIVLIKEITLHLDTNDIGAALAEYIKAREATEIPPAFSPISGSKFRVKYELDITEPTNPKLMGATVTLTKE